MIALLSPCTQRSPTKRCLPWSSASFPLHINGEPRFCHFFNPSMHRPSVTIDALLPVRMEMTEHTKLLANQNSTWDAHLLRSSVASAEDNASP